MKKTLITIFILFYFGSINAQNVECGFDKLYRYYLDSSISGTWEEKNFTDRLQKFRQNFPNPNQEGGIHNRSSDCLGKKYIIPVIVHIVHSLGDSIFGIGSNISNQQVLDQMDILNEAMSKAFSGNQTNAGEPDMYFCIPEFGGKKAIYRYASAHTDIPVNGINILDSLKGTFPNNKNYIHIYIVNSIIDGNNSTTAGIGVHPLAENTWRPGIIIARKFLGDASANNGYNLDTRSRGLVLVHEIGHFLGLYHTFHDGCKGQTDANCATDGDKCCDTPPVQAANTTCTPVNSCFETSIDNNDLIENQMDYTPDNCRNLFTPDQIAIMHFTLINYRPALINPEFLSTIKLPCSVNSPWFMTDVSEICDSGEVTFTGIWRTGVPSPAFIWKIYKNNILINSQSNGSNIFTVYLRDTGDYQIVLKVKPYDCDTITLKRDNLVKVKNCGPILHNPNAVWNFGEMLSVEYHENGTIATNNAIKVNPYPGINSVQTAISVSDDNGVLRFYGGNDDGASVFNLPPNRDKRVKLWYRDTAKGTDQLTIRSANEYIKGTGNALQNLVVVRPGYSTEYWWVTLFNGANSGHLYYRKIALNNANTYDISGAANIALKGPIGFPADSGAVFSGEAISAVASANDSFYWMFFLCPSNSGTSFDSTLVIYKILSDTLMYFNSIKVNEPGNGVIKVSPDGRWVYTNSNLYEFNRFTGAIQLKHSFYDNIDKLRNRTTAAEFSPNSRYLYVARRNYLNTRPTVDSVLQLDLNRNDPYAFRKTIAITSRSFFLLFQRTPNGQIAIIRSNYIDMLDMIQSPDSICSFAKPNNCDLKFNAFNPIISGRTDMHVNISMPDPVNTLSQKLERRISFYVDSCFQYHFTHNLPWATNSIWYFGDGSQANGREVSHTYIKGSYLVYCIIGNDTLRCSISVKQKMFTIAGKIGTCDSTQFAFYNVNEENSELNYRWGVINGSNSYENNLNLSKIKWYGAGFVNVQLTDQLDQCYYYDTLFTTPQSLIANNLISGDTLFCGNEINISGSTPSGGIGNFTYSWVLTRNGFEYSMDSFNKSLVYPTKLVKYNNAYVYRNVISNGCVSRSNLKKVIIKTAFNKLNIIPNGCQDKLTDADTLNRIDGSTFLWQYSVDSLNWQIIENQSNASYLISEKSWPLKYFRRISDIPVCGYDTSNVIKIEGFIYIKEQPTDVAGCGNMMFSMLADIYNSRKITSTYRWQYRDNLDWINLPVFVGSGSMLIDSVNNYLHGTTFRLKIANSCFTIYSNSAVLKKVVSPSIISTDLYKTVVLGEQLKLKGEWAGERNVCYAVWQKSMNPEGGIWDSIGKTTLDSFIVTPPNLNECQQRYYYRISLRNLCPSAFNSKKYWANTVVSNSIEVGGFQKPSLFSDLWMPDSKRDNGSEPNWIDSQNYTSSLALWNRNWASKFQRVNDWTDREDLQTDRDTNFIHVMIYNRGNQPASNAKINLYWTVMSVNEDWPFSWTGLSKFHNLDLNNDTGKFNGPNGKKLFPMGGRINKTPIELNDFLSTKGGQLNSGDSVMLTYPWTQSDTVPKPEWYYIVTKSGEHRKSNHIGICLLARMLECDSPNFALSYPEKLNYGNSNIPFKSSYKRNIGYNVMHNNNLVSENFFLGYMKPPFNDTVHVFTLGAAKPIEGSDTIGTRDIKFKLCVNDPTFYNHGEVLITLSDDFWDLFIAAGSPGVLISSPSSHQLIINNSCAEIGPITVPDTFSTFLGLTWRYKNGSNNAGALINSLFTLSEYNEAEFIGSTQYGIKSYQNGLGGSNEGPSEGPLVIENDYFTNEAEAQNEKIKLTVTPNPFDNYFDIKYQGLAVSKLRIEMYDANGKLVKLICDCTSDSEGLVSIRTETINFAQGIYTVKAIVNGKTIAERLIRCQ